MPRTAANVSPSLLSILQAWGRHVSPHDLKEIPIVDEGDAEDIGSWGLSSDSEEDVSYIAPDMPHSSHSWQP